VAGVYDKSIMDSRHISAPFTKPSTRYNNALTWLLGSVPPWSPGLVGLVRTKVVCYSHFYQKQREHNELKGIGIKQAPFKGQHHRALIQKIRTCACRHAFDRKAQVPIKKEPRQVVPSQLSIIHITFDTLRFN
jgi:hypothetical protein